MFVHGGFCPITTCVLVYLSTRVFVLIICKEIAYFGFESLKVEKYLPDFKCPCLNFKQKLENLKRLCLTTFCRQLVFVSLPYFLYKFQKSHWWYYFQACHKMAERLIQWSKNNNSVLLFIFRSRQIERTVLQINLLGRSLKLTTNDD